MGVFNFIEIHIELGKKTISYPLKKRRKFSKLGGNYVLKNVIEKNYKGVEDEKEEVSSY